jgi:uncharacterized membrane protein YraQ (UPF0718 family)
LGSTLILSLGGGYITHLLVQRGWLGEHVLRKAKVGQVKTLSQTLRDALRAITDPLKINNATIRFGKPALALSATECQEPGCNVEAYSIIQSTADSLPVIQSTPEIPSRTSQCSVETGTNCSSEEPVEAPFWKRLAIETWNATTMVIKFMLLAWFIGALIRLYVPEQWITGILGNDNPWSISTAALLGVPVYTSNLMAMPLVGGLLAQGMHPAAALAFLIAGPITTLPAMSAVWGIVNRRVFVLYISFALVSAVSLGYAYNLVLSF